MDENPYRSSDTALASDPQPRTTIGRLLGLASIVLVGSIVGLIGIFIVTILVEQYAGNVWGRGEVRYQRLSLCLFGGLIFGALAGLGLFELIQRPRHAKRP